jgi:carbonic anhydrase
MKLTQHSKLLATACCFAMPFLLACNSMNSEKKKALDSIASNHHAPADTLLSDNEVKAVAPDAGIKTEQGYALPRHTDNFAQSPIDIISGKADKGKNEPLSFAIHSDLDAAENLGHTVELEFKEGSTCTINGKNFSCKQFHFHTPSEHLVDGITFPMEMHVVSALRDSADANKTSYVVVGVLFKIGAENKFLKEFLNKIPAKEGEKTELHTGEVRFEDLVSQFTKNDIGSYYTYNGSLTTPPFTESVQWVIMKHVVEASEEQIMTVEKMEGNNARHVQATNNRKVYSSD